MRIGQALAAAAASGLDRLDSQLLLLHASRRSSRDRAWLLAHEDDPLPEAVRADFMQACARRASGEPLAYITGHKEFFGLDLRVDARVLVPRPETETLVEWALEVLRDGSAPAVADLGTGSGAIALAIKQQRPDARVTAIDRSAGALEVARGNARELGLDIAFQEGSWLAGTDRRFDLIVSNPPYVAQGDAHLASLGHEPLEALVAGSQGLDAIAAIIGQAAAHLVPTGWLLLEHGYDQAGPVAALLAGARLRRIGNRRDLAGIIRCSGGQWLELG